MTENNETPLVPEQKPKKSLFKRIFKLSYQVSIHLLALAGFVLLAGALAVKMKWTNDGGNVDLNSRYFSEMANKYNLGFKTDSVTLANNERKMLQNVGVLAKYYPYNAKQILASYEQTKDVMVAIRMLDAVNLKLKKNKKYQKEIAALNSKSNATVSLYPWANYREWKEFCNAVKKDKHAIDSVSMITGVESRLIVTCLVGEQIRMFNSARERWKKNIIPFTRLIMTKNRGYGVTGILQNTALKIEANIFDSKSQFYPGKYFEQLLNVNDSFPESIVDTIEAHKYKTIQRLIQGGDHYYSYLYTAFFIRQFQAQWERQGYTLAYRPEIIGTLYNLGFQKSKPKKNPAVGGSNFNVGDQEYTFGGLCYEFYYSGELQDLFPMTSQPFVPVKELEKKFKFEPFKPKEEEMEEVVVR